MNRDFSVYILCNARRTVLYIGITNDLSRRLAEHRDRSGVAFTARYNVVYLVYAETFEYAYEAITREKQLKKWSRRKKIALIESVNPEWKDIAGS